MLTNGSKDTAGNELDMLIAKRDALVQQRDALTGQIEAYDTAISALMVFQHPGIPPRIYTSPSKKYQGVPVFDAAISYMDEHKLNEVTVQELTDVLLAGGAYLGKDTKRRSTMVKIAITQNNKAGRKELTREKNRIVRKARKGSAA